MESTKLAFHPRLLLSFTWVSLFIVCFFSCDVLDPDADVLRPDLNVSGEQIYVYGSNSTFIDLATKVRTNQPVRFKVTSAPQFGALSDLGKGLLQYTPPASDHRSDAFEFTIFSDNNTVLSVDTLILKIESDSTDLPCGIFPADDYAYGVRPLVPVVVPVLANDYICSADSADIEVSVVVLGEDSPPYFGEARIVGQSISYTAAEEFSGEDKIIYKVNVRSKPDNTASYGIVYLSGQNPCDFFPSPDVFAFDIDSLASEAVFLPVLLNDSLCATTVPFTLQVAQQPVYGLAIVSNDGVSYKLSDTVAITNSFVDYFTYELCDGIHCKTAIVKLQAREAPGSCKIIARQDTIDLSGNEIPLMYLDVLINDELCGGYTSFAITQAPHHGTAYVSEEMKAIAYQRDPFQNKNDSLEYKICRLQECSRAKVYIKREK